MAITIRRLRRGEWREYRGTMLRLFSTGDTGFAWLTSPEEAARRSNKEWRRRAKTRRDQAGRFFVAEADGTWVGTLGVNIQRTENGRSGLLTLVWVDPAYRGRPAEGGPPIVDRLIDAAAYAVGRDRRLHSLTLNVGNDNGRAQAAYRRNGFDAVGPAKSKEKKSKEPPRTHMVRVINETDKPLARVKLVKPAHRRHTRTQR